MGNIKTSFVKKTAKRLHDQHGEKFTDDFTKNKEIIKELIDIRSKKLRNIIAGYVTNLKNRN